MKRILFSGGCHLAGYPIGDNFSFYRILERRSQAEQLRTEFRRTGLKNLNHGGSISRECVNSECEFLVLQVGNYETTTGFKKYFRLGRHGSGSSSSSSVAHGRSPFGSKLSALAWKFRSETKWALDTMLRHPLVQVTDQRERLLAFIDEIRKEWMGPVLLVGPTPCADRTTNHYRKLLLPVYRECCHSRGIPFLDAFEAFHGPGGSRPSLPDYHDSLHLSRVGHEKLARLIWPHLKSWICSKAAGSDGVCPAEVVADS